MHTSSSPADYLERLQSLKPLTPVTVDRDEELSKFMYLAITQLGENKRGQS